MYYVRSRDYVPLSSETETHRLSGYTVHPWCVDPLPNPHPASRPTAGFAPSCVKRRKAERHTRRPLPTGYDQQKYYVLHSRPRKRASLPSHVVGFQTILIPSFVFCSPPLPNPCCPDCGRELGSNALHLVAMSALESMAIQEQRKGVITGA